MPMYTHDSKQNIEVASASHAINSKHNLKALELRLNVTYILSYP